MVCWWYTRRWSCQYDSLYGDVVQHGMPEKKPLTVNKIYYYCYY